MKTHSFIQIEQICLHYHVEESFIHYLHELGHIELRIERNTYSIAEENLKGLERLILFHTDLQINREGIDVIAHLLNKITTLQEELNASRNKGMGWNQFQDKE